MRIPMIDIDMSTVIFRCNTRLSIRKYDKHSASFHACVVEDLVHECEWLLSIVLVGDKRCLGCGNAHASDFA